MSNAVKTVLPGDVRVGDRVKFIPDSNERAWWTVKAVNDEHIVAVRQAPFMPKGELFYTVTGHMERGYNGLRPGLIRLSLNTLGSFELSRRRAIAVEEIIVEITPEEAVDPSGRHARQAARA